MNIIKQLIKIVVANIRIEIYRSVEVVDKRTEYDVYYSNREKNPAVADYYVSKNLVQNSEPTVDNLKAVLYVSSVKFDKDPDHYLKKVITAYKEKYSKFRWYLDLGPVQYSKEMEKCYTHL